MIVENQRGGIALCTAPGEGTTFSIYLPTADISAKSPGQNGTQPFRNGNGRSILIADDEIAIAEIMRETLQGAGYKVTLASDGVEALAVVDAAKPEIAVVDLLMPRSGGSETIRVLRTRFPSVRIVAISGLSAAEAEQGAVGADVILQKPFTITDLLGAVEGEAS